MAGVLAGATAPEWELQHAVDRRPADAERLGDGRGSPPPEIPEPIRRQLRVTHRVLNIAVPEPRLQRPRIMPLVRKLVTAAVAQHVGMDSEGHTRTLTEAPDQGMEALRRHRRAALGYEHVRAWCLFSLQAT